MKKNNSSTNKLFKSKTFEVQKKINPAQLKPERTQYFAKLTSHDLTGDL